MVPTHREGKAPLARIFHGLRAVRGSRGFVAQVSNLLYRRLPVARPYRLVASADWKSAIQQAGSLRYAFRLAKRCEMSGLGAACQRPGLCRRDVPLPANLIMSFRAVSLTPPLMGVSGRRSEKATVSNGLRTPPRISAPQPKPLKRVLNSFAAPPTPMNGGVNERLRPKRGIAPAQVVIVRIAAPPLPELQRGLRGLRSCSFAGWRCCALVPRAKAVEDYRSPRRFATTRAAARSDRSWTAPVLWRFGAGAARAAVQILCNNSARFPRYGVDGELRPMKRSVNATFQARSTVLPVNLACIYRTRLAPPWPDGCWRGRPGRGANSVCRSHCEISSVLPAGGKT